MKKNQHILFSLKTLVDSTNDFHADRRLGAGGFGIVYKGLLDDGRVVAIKRFTLQCVQGIDDFLNEITVLTEIQHRKLVVLLGGCVEASHRMLVYEYMENNSLDKILFENEKAKNLNWNHRCNIIIGVAQGLMYLHEEARNTIIHRDIKAASVLLDSNLNAKIADFGMAKLFPNDITQMQSRLMGTIGYMAPEYIFEGQVSAKADVYSFGILVLEILSGQRNTQQTQTLLQTAWLLLEQGDIWDIVDESIKTSSAHEDISRVIQVALLCTQGNQNVRPWMSEVTVMLTNKAVAVPAPCVPPCSSFSFQNTPANSLQNTPALSTAQESESSC